MNSNILAAQAELDEINEAFERRDKIKALENQLDRAKKIIVEYIDPVIAEKLLKDLEK